MVTTYGRRMNQELLEEKFETYIFTIKNKLDNEQLKPLWPSYRLDIENTRQDYMAGAKAFEEINKGWKESFDTESTDSANKSALIEQNAIQILKLEEEIKKLNGENLILRGYDMMCNRANIIVDPNKIPEVEATIRNLVIQQQKILARCHNLSEYLSVELSLSLKEIEEIEHKVRL